MGVLGLLKAMKNAMDQVDITKLEGQRAAVDISTWMYTTHYSSQTTPAQNIYQKLLVLRQCGVEPVVVFDGEALPAKAEIAKKRQDRRDKLRDKADNLMKLGNKREAIKIYRQCALKRSPQIVGNIKQFCRCYGFEYWHSPYESDAQIAYLMRKGLVDFVITIDSDLIVYNCEKILYNPVFKDNGATGILFEQTKIKDCWGMTYDEDCFLAACILTKCDYFPTGLVSFGIIKAKTLFRKLERPFEYGNMVSLLSQMGFEVDDEFTEKFFIAFHTFKHQLVHGLDGSTIPLQPYDDGMNAANYAFAGKPSAKGEHWFPVDNSSLPSIPKISLNESFYCNKCRNHFATCDELLMHNKKDHKIRCSVCNRVFTTRFNLKVHMNMHQRINSRIRSFKCVTCGKVCKTAANLRLHEKIEHSTASECLFPCKKCDKVFASPYLLFHHKLVHFDERPHQCTECDAGFTSKDSLTEHLRIHDESTLVECSKCGQVYRRICALKLHEKTCNGKPGVRCPVCPQGFNEDGTMRHHVRDIHPEHVWQPKMRDGPYKCPVCFQGFTRKDLMTPHLKKHHPDYEEPADTRPFKCPQCDQGFTNEQNMRYHFRRDHPGYPVPPWTGLKPYSCPVPECGNAFPTHGILAKHVAEHHPGQPSLTKPKAYPCPVDGCLNGYAREQRLKEHLSAKHQGYTPPAPANVRERPWECNACHKRYFTRESLNSHIRLHPECQKPSTSKE